MGLYKKTICQNCGKQYSALKSDCPNCGERKQSFSTRTPRSSDAVRRRTGKENQADNNTKWQFIIGLCLVAAVITSVIVLITTTLNGKYDEPAQPSPSVENTYTPSPTPSPSQTPPPTPTVESITITYFGQEKTEFTTTVGSTTQLGATVYPLEVDGPVEWSTTDESKITVDENGLVTAVGKGTASVIVRCYGGAAECKVIVR